MKINEKHLAFFAGPKGPIEDKKGYLGKRGEVNKAFQRRWFVLKGNLLFYYEKQTDTEPIGVIILEGCSVVYIEHSEKFCFELSFAAQGSRTYIFSADCQTDAEEWMRALASSTYDFIKTSISYLQHQVDEITYVKRQNQPFSLAHRSKLIYQPKEEEIAALEQCTFSGYKDFDYLHKEYGRIILGKIGRSSVLLDPLDVKLIDI